MFIGLKGQVCVIHNQIISNMKKSLPHERHSVAVSTTDSSHDDEFQLDDDRNPVRCLTCYSPHPALYRRLGSHGSDIQLLSCRRHCGLQQMMDPYCERELLLVLMDVWVLRVMAHRHLLCHRHLQLDDNDDDGSFVLNQDQFNNTSLPNDNNNTKKNSNGTPPPSSHRRRRQRIRHVGLVFLASVVIQSHVGIIALNHNDHVTTTNHDQHNYNDALPWLLRQWMIYTVTSTVGYLVQIMGATFACAMVLYLRRQRRRRWMEISSSSSTTTLQPLTTTSSTRLPTDGQIVMQSMPYITFLCSISILYPSVCINGCTSLIHMWENSDTVRNMGTIFVTLHQVIFLVQVMQIIICSTNCCSR